MYTSMLKNIGKPFVMHTSDKMASPRDHTVTSKAAYHLPRMFGVVRVLLVM
jgi:hypothetical protein